MHRLSTRSSPPLAVSLLSSNRSPGVRSRPLSVRVRMTAAWEAVAASTSIEKPPVPAGSRPVIDGAAINHPCLCALCKSRRAAELVHAMRRKYGQPR